VTVLAPTVYVVDDDPSIREALSALLRSIGLQVQLFASAQEFLAYRRPDAPGCLVLDVRLPGQNGLELQRAIAALADPVPIIFITGHGDIPMSVRAMKAGATEFLTKPFREHDLISAVWEALEGDRSARRGRAELADLRGKYRILTLREREVLPLVVHGLLNKQVAAQLGISEVTIKVHRSRIMKKMRARSLPELVRMVEKLNRAAPHLQRERGAIPKGR
jgi:FixJ family two-component response regulator